MKSSIKVVSVSSKGQIVIPQDFRTRLKLRKGSHIVIIEEGGILLLKKEEDVKDEFSDMMKRSESSLKDVWESKEDAIWNKYLE